MGGGREEGKKEEDKKEKKKRETYVRYVFSPQTVRRTLDFFFFSSLVLFTLFFSFATSKSSQSHRPTFEARRDSPGPFFSFFPSPTI